MQIKLVDNNFEHQPGLSPFIAPTHSFRREIDNPDVVIFTDSRCFNDDVDSYKCKKIAWIIEPPIVNGENHSNIAKPEFYTKFDKVCTYNRWLEDKIDNFSFVAHGGTWLRKEDIDIWGKTKACSMIYSDKSWNAGHKQRLRVVESLKNNNSEVEYFGSGCNKPVDYKITALKDYRFSIAMENEAPPYLFAPNNDYFSEKLLDCFLTGTIPLYYGNPTITNYFNHKGMIIFTDPDQILDAISNTSEDFYNNAIEAVRENYELAKSYINPEDAIYKQALNV